MLFLALVLYEAGRVVVAKQTVNEKFKTALTQKDGFVSLTDISKDYIDIFLQVEDPMFYAHKGIDFKTPGAGLTTVSQSLTKRLFFKQFKPGFAKLEQSLIARFVVHPTISKDDQLLAFFRHIYT
ncbi:MAG: hypothetical protein COA91_07810 [Robiginitomaculum sp.]|nr:MAG: hypothetical protein COA91_07810 [Robiginitomaculum sp.]